MMFGNAAPAPFSWTCARAAAGNAASRSRRDFMSLCSPCALERELRLEVSLRPRCLERRCRRAALVRQQVDIGEQPKVRRELIRGAADDAGQPVVADVGVWVRQVYAGQHRRLRVREAIDTEEAGD